MALVGCVMLAQAGCVFGNSPDPLEIGAEAPLLKGGIDVASSWVALSRKDASAQPLVYKLHHRPEYELYQIERDPFELKNEINNPEYGDVIEELKKQLHTKLAELGDADPIATETSLVKVEQTNETRRKKQ